MQLFLRPASLLLCLLGLMLFNPQKGDAQETHETAVVLTFKEIKKTGPKSFEYSVYATNTGKTGIALKAYSWGLNMAEGWEQCGTITHKFISRDQRLNGIPLPKSAFMNAQLRGTTISATRGNEAQIEPGKSICLATMEVQISASWPSCYQPFKLVSNHSNTQLQAIQLTQMPGKTQCILSCFLDNNFSTTYMLIGKEGKKMQGTLPVLEASFSPSPESANALKLNCK